jgi:hypothetical protein
MAPAAVLADGNVKPTSNLILFFVQDWYCL